MWRRKLTADNKTVCCKHYTQFKKFGYFKDNSSRTPRDKNNITIDGDIALIDLYDKHYNVIAQAIIDAEDVDKIKYIKWRLNCNGYVMNNSRTDIFLHRRILNVDTMVDHKNGNRLDNRKCNLRVATPSTNQMNVNYVGICRYKGKFIDKDGNELNNAAENPAGNIVHMAIAKSKIFEATRRVGYYTINYVHGPDVINDYVEVGKQVGVINQRGAFFDIIDTATGEVLNTDKIQGKVKLKLELQSHPEWLRLIDSTMNGKNVEEVVDATVLQEANKLANESGE